jgi:outer membrane protein assembly factor BamB
VVVAGGLAGGGWALTRPGGAQPAAAAAGGSRAAWVRKTGGPVSSIPAASQDGQFLYIASDDGTVYAYDAATGRPADTFKVGRTVSGVSVSGATVLAGAADGTVYAFAQGKGQSWTYLAGGAITAAPVEFTATVYVGCAASRGRGQLNSLSYDSGLDHGISAYWRFPADGPIHGTPVHDNEAIYTATTAGTVYGLAVSTSDPAGNQLWSRRLGGAVQGGPTVHDSVLYVGCDDGYLYAIDTSDGSVNWRYQAGGPIRSRIVTANGLIYFGSLDHQVYALNA